MSKFKTFFRTLVKSVTSFPFYHDVVRAPLSFSIKYSLFLSFLLGLAMTTAIMVPLSPLMFRFSERFVTRAANLFPADLVVTVEGGQLSTNVAEPLRIPMPYELFVEVPPAVSDEQQAYLVTIDTSATVEDAAGSQSILFVTKDHLVMNDPESPRFYPLSDAPDTVIDQTVVANLLLKIEPFVKMVPWIVLIFLSVVLMFVMPLMRLIKILFLTVLTLVAARIMKVPLSFARLYQVGLHTYTVPLLLVTIINLFGIIIPVPFFSTLVFLLFTLVVLAELRNPSKSRAKRK